jgi:hypothetical protein
MGLPAVGTLTESHEILERKSDYLGSVTLLEPFFGVAPLYP